MIKSKIVNKVEAENQYIWFINKTHSKMTIHPKTKKVVKFSESLVGDLDLIIEYINR